MGTNSSDLDVLNELYQKCKENRISGNSDKAYSYFKICMKFLEINPIYTNLLKVNIPSDKLGLIYKLLEEFTIFSYYISKKKEGIIISDKLILNNESRKYINFNMLCSNQKYYMEKIPYKTKHQIKVKCEEHFIEMNPSIIKLEKEGSTVKYLLNCRTSNFGLKPGGNYYCKNPDGIVDTINYILELDNDFNIISNKEVIDLSKNKLYQFRPIKGLEDLIIFYHNNELYGTCTTLDTHENGTPQISLCKLENIELDPFSVIAEKGHDKYIINEKVPLNIIEKGRPEKNWLPFSIGEGLNFIYSYSPTIIRQYSNNKDEVGKTEILINNKTELNFDRFRGSAGPIPFYLVNRNGWLVVVHEVSWNQDNSRVYTHRFIYMNDEFKIISISLPWIFESLGIEFCRSMCHSHNDEIILTCGIKDEEAWCYIIDKKVIIEMLKGLEEFQL